MNQPSELNPNYWEMGIASIPVVLVAAFMLTTLVLALADRHLTLGSRLLWAALILVIPLLGAVLYVVLRARTAAVRNRRST